MANLVKEANEQLKEVIMKAMGMAVADGKFEPVPLPPFTIEIPNDKSHGDFAANVAMVCAKALKMNPRQIATILMERMIFDGTYFLQFGFNGGSAFLIQFYAVHSYIIKFTDFLCNAAGFMFFGSQPFNQSTQLLTVVFGEHIE